MIWVVHKWTSQDVLRPEAALSLQANISEECPKFDYELIIDSEANDTITSMKSDKNE